MAELRRSPGAASNDYVLIEARLTGTDQNYTYAINQEERTFDLKAPSATFEIIQPKSLAGRTLRIIFHVGEIEVSDYQINRIEPVSNSGGR